MTNTQKRTPAPSDTASESELGEEDPGAALESLSESPEPPAARDGKPSADTPLESPMPRSPILEREEPPTLASEEDIGSQDDAPKGQDAPVRDRRAKAGKKPGARKSASRSAR